MTGGVGITGTKVLGKPGTDDYNELNNKPLINGNELKGDKSFEDLGLEYVKPEQLEEVNTEIQKINNKISSVYVYKGSVNDRASLPEIDREKGDVYNLLDTGMNVAWNGEEWDDLGSTFDPQSLETEIQRVDGKVDTLQVKVDGLSKSYNDLTDKPQINNVELKGNVTLDKLGIAAKTSIPTNLSNLTNDIFVVATDENDAISKSANGKLAYWSE